MSATIPTIEPSSFVAGDLVKWAMSLPDYLPADGWTLHYAFVKDGTAAIVVDGTNNGDGTHLITISLVVSATFATGDWGYQAYVTLGSPTVTERYTVRNGMVEVKPAYSGESTGYDSRSTARQMLDLIEALLVQKLTRGDVASYSISTGTGSRSLATLSNAELLQARDKLRAEVAREDAVDRISKGLGSKKKVVVRFV